ncbi:penicillin-binding protein 1C [Desertibaculum subflavum]|uniref:penicillin-binding protein 1C n=1 Tax=Desertibaculum subflavum TaxID=2268458 RepID=UPI000E66C556
MIGRRLQRWLIGAVGALVALVAADRLLPPDLSKLDDLSVVVADRRGEPLRIYLSRDQQYRLPVALEQVDRRYVDLLLAYEDARFATHPGIDPLAVARALRQWADNGRVVSGASTLTMQVARLLEPRPRTFGAKIVESLRALQLEWRYSKDEILGIYLTLAPFGGNLQGIEAATRAYFGKGPAELTLGEVALLIALPQSPTARRPDLAPERARAAAHRVLDRLAAAGAITDVAAREAKQERLADARLRFPFAAPHLADRLRRGGASFVHTTIDGDLQRSMEGLATREAGAIADGATIAVIVVEHEGRRVAAYIGGHDYFSAQGQVDAARAVRSPGSTLKPLIYAFAFDDLTLHPETKIADTPIRFGNWAPRNFDRGFRGEVTVREALQQSLNLPAVAVLDRIGADRFRAGLQQAGIRLDLPRAAQAAGLPIALGGAGTTLNDLVTLYAGLANHGRIAPSRLLMDDAGAEPVQLVSASAAWYVARILADAPRPDALFALAAEGDRRRVAYKTGTSYGFRDAWAIGWSASHTIGVWVGRLDGTPRPGQYGRNTAAPILFKAFDLVPGNRGLTDDPPPDAAIAGAPNRRLPVALKKFRPKGGVEPEQGGALRIAFPPDGSTIERDRDVSGLVDALPFEALGGTPPYRWLVNGRLLAPSERFAEARWTPDGEGFARIVVVDAKGRAAHADIRVK